MYKLSTSRYQETHDALSPCFFPPGQDGPPADSFVNPQRTGWLTKHGGSGMGANWRKRWFVLDHHYIFYYKQKNVRAFGSCGKEQAMRLFGGRRCCWLYYLHSVHDLRLFEFAFSTNLAQNNF